MKRNGYNLFFCRLELITPVLICALLAFPIHAQNNSHGILIQRSPAHGGAVSPADGIIKDSKEIFLDISATPYSGFEFAYWLGDVIEPTSSITTVRTDEPKIIIAVFKRSSEIIPSSAGQRPKSIIKSRNRGPSSLLNSSPAGRIQQGFPIMTYVPPPENPIPPPPNIPIPEPASLFMLLSGVLFVKRVKRNRRA